MIDKTKRQNKDGLKKCQCKSKPDYHLENCPVYDVFGQQKVLDLSPLITFPTLNVTDQENFNKQCLDRLNRQPN